MYGALGALSCVFQVKTLVTYPYAIKNQRKAKNTFGCLELVLYGIRELA